MIELPKSQTITDRDGHRVTAKPNHWRGFDWIRWRITHAVPGTAKRAMTVDPRDLRGRQFGP